MLGQYRPMIVIVKKERAISRKGPERSSERSIHIHGESRKVRKVASPGDGIREKGRKVKPDHVEDKTGHWDDDLHTPHHRS